MAELEERIKKMSEFLNEEAIAQAFNIPVETVVTILSGKARVTCERGLEEKVLHVQSVAHRQKVIGVWRGKGGVGCTAVAMCLAQEISNLMNVLLIDLCLAEGGSDLTHYMNLPETDRHVAQKCVSLNKLAVNAGHNLHVIQVPVVTEESYVLELIAKARQEYDAVVLDLPNDEGKTVKEAVTACNTLVMIIGALRQEIVRIHKRTAHFQNKDRFAVVSDCDLEEELVKQCVGTEAVVTIPHDDDLDRALEEQRFPVNKFPFMEGVKELMNLIYSQVTGHKAKRRSFKLW